MNLLRKLDRLSPTRPVFFGTRSSTLRTLRKYFSSGLILREIDKIRPWNCHECRSLEFMAKLDQKTLCPLRALAIPSQREAGERYCFKFFRGSRG